METESKPVSKLGKLWKDYFIQLKLLYFGINLTFYAIYQMRSPYLKKFLHFSATEITIGTTILAFVTFVGSPFWTFLCDRYKRPKILMVISLVGSFVSWSITMKPDCTAAEFYAIMGFYGFFISGLIPLLDYSALFVLMEHPNGKREYFSFQKLFGTVAYAVASFIASRLIDVKMHLYYWFIFANVVSLITVLLLFPGDGKFKRKHAFTKPDEQAADANVQKEKEERPNPFALFKVKSFVIFMFCILLTGFCRNMFTTYLTMYAKDKIASPEDIGISSFVTAGTEIALFLMAKRMLETMGPYWMILIAQISSVIRSIIYLLFSVQIIDENVKNGWVFVVVESLKGVSAALVQATGVQIAHSTAPAGLESTSQGVFSSIYNGISAVLANALGGLLISLDESYRQFFITSLAICIITFIVMFVQFGFIDYHLWKRSAVKKDIELEMKEEETAKVGKISIYQRREPENDE